MPRKFTFWSPLAMIGLALALVACSGTVAAELPDELPESLEVELRAGAQEIEFTGTLQARAGDEWTVSDITFAVTPETEVHGQLAVGDSVKVHAFLDEEGNLIAREIEAAGVDDEDDRDEGEIEFTGVLEDREGDAWTVGGRRVLIGPQTEIKGDPALGDLVKVHASRNDAGDWVAREIEPAEENDRREAEQDDDGEIEFTGVVQAIGPEAWTVGGRTVGVTAATEIEPGIGLGDRVKVHAFPDASGMWIAREIDPADPKDYDDERDEDHEGELEFVGTIDLIAGSSLVVDGITIQIVASTDVETDLRVGTTVEVKAFVTVDGQFIAEEIEAEDDDRHGADAVEDDEEDDESEDDHDDDRDDDDREDDEHEDDDDDRSGSNSGSG